MEENLEIQKIIESLDGIRSCLDSAFDEGTIDIDKIIADLQALKPLLVAIDERMKMMRDMPPGKRHPIPGQIALCAEDYR